MRNDSRERVTQMIAISKDWRYKIHINDSARFSGLRGKALIPYLERTVQSGYGWSFSETHTFEQELTVDMPPRTQGRAIVEWRPLSCRGLIITGTAEPDIKFSIDVGFTFGLEVELTNLG